MDKEDRTFPIKNIQDDSENVVALRSLPNIGKIYLSKPYYRKSTTNVFMQCSTEPSLINDEILIKKNFSPCEESKKQSLQELQRNDTKTVREFERLFLKRAPLTQEKKGQLSPTIQDEYDRQMNSTMNLMLLRSDLELQNSQLDDLISDNILLSNNSANLTLPKSKSLIARKKIKKTALIQGQIPKISTNPKQPKSKSQILRKIIPKNSSKSDQTPKITSKAKLPKSNSRILQKIPSKNSTIVKQTSKTLTDAVSTRNKPRVIGKTPSKITKNTDHVSKTSIESVKYRSTKTKFQNDSQSEKSAMNEISINRAPQLPEMKSSNKHMHKAKKRNPSKTLSFRSRSRSESTNSSGRRCSDTSISIQQHPTTEALTHLETINNDTASESKNIPEFNQTPNSNCNESSTTNTSQEITLSSIITPATEIQVNLNPPENDQAENAPSSITNHEDSHFTSPSERLLNLHGDIQQSAPETRTQPIPTDPNLANTAKHDLEEWLRNTAAQSDTSRPKKTSLMHPYPVFPVIRPCDTDIINDSEDCKKKLKQKLERMHKLKQAYYADPEDNIPFINLAYTKEGVFIDEPIQNAFVYEDDFFKNNESSEFPQWSLEIRGNKSNSALFSSPRLNLKNDKGSTSFTRDKLVDNKSSHSKWMKKILDETEINMMENVLHECQHKFNKLAINIQQVSWNSETSSNNEPVQGSKQRIIIPKRSSRSDK